jgi:hypothetical protein
MMLAACQYGLLDGIILQRLGNWSSLIYKGVMWPNSRDISDSFQKCLQA